MKKSSVNSFNFLKSAGLLFLIILNVSNCKEKVEGCADIEATNFAFDLDLPCPDDCCIYPTMTFEVDFRIGPQNLVYGNPYIMPSGKVIKIMKTKLYISDISLTNDAESIKVTDLIELDVNGASSNPTTFTDDFTLVSRDFASFSYEFGSIRGSGTFDSLRFSVGLDPLANKVEPASAPEDHPLSVQTDSMWSLENAYVFNKLIMIPDTIPPRDTLTFNVNENLNRVDIVLPYQVDLAVGTNLVVPLKIDYFQWFEGIDFEDDPKTVIVEIVNNTAKAFSINE